MAFVVLADAPHGGSAFGAEEGVVRVRIHSEEAGREVCLVGAGGAVPEELPGLVAGAVLVVGVGEYDVGQVVQT